MAAFGFTKFRLPLSGASTTVFFSQAEARLVFFVRGVAFGEIMLGVSSLKSLSL
jgi:hypothetical protein